jgi:glycine hydroxymethyltransferase
VVGVVTSCSIDTDGYQTGQAYLKDEFARDGTPVYVFSGTAHARDGSSKPLADLKFGDKALMPDAATVLSHFPAKRK